MCSRWANSACSAGVCALMPMRAAPWRASSSTGIAERAALRRAAARARDVVPAVEQRLARHARARVDVDDEPLLRRLGEVELAAQRRGEGDARHLGAGQVDGGAVVDRHREVGGKVSPVAAHGPHCRVWSARVRGLRVRVPDRRRRLGRLRARGAPERGRARGLPGRGRPGLRAVRGRALAARHPRRPAARLLALLGDRARGPLAAARADHGRLLGAQRVRGAARARRPTTTNGATAGATPHRAVPRARRARAARAAFAEEELSPWHRAFARRGGSRRDRPSGQRARRCAGTRRSPTSTPRASART